MRWLLMLAVLLLGMSGVAHAGEGRMVRIEAFASERVQPRAVTIWLPSGYDREPAKRFPVLYVQDGGSAFGPQRLDIDGAISRLSGEGKMRAAIVVAVSATELRSREYFPAKLYELMPPDYRASADRFTGGAPMGDAYAAFLATELKPFIDREYRTLAGPADTSILGVSLGGMIAFYALGEYPKVFGQAAGLSPYWPLGNPVGPPIGTPEGATTMVNIFATWLMRSKADPKINRLYMDRGTLTLDWGFAPFTDALNLVMPALGWVRGRTWESRVYPGGDHSNDAWRVRMDVPLIFLIGS
ncbi:alpha/beta hydrolase-fold protein [Sphingomonas sp. AOB5]|uniref:alpha/beta hydrolase n=1 Tax=Sphingomonas sp. AOB5 TaxID=3034017 RepID=UPI0023FA0B10|nr:alpha/beta hydrolase-fold protein [Sphingomonas sp. AOB5]MDF7777577.1 alpha/beta hydrolase-fold protein [Sphingomonas sp. AOB5]